MSPRHAVPLHTRVCQVFGVTDLGYFRVGLLRPVRSRPSKVISKAFRTTFHRMAQRRRPVPVGSSAMTAMYTQLRAACSLGKRRRARTALRMRALTLSVALVEQKMQTSDGDRSQAAAATGLSNALAGS